MQPGYMYNDFFINVQIVLPYNRVGKANTLQNLDKLFFIYHTLS